MLNHSLLPGKTLSDTPPPQPLGGNMLMDHNDIFIPFHIEHVMGIFKISPQPPDL